MLPAGRAPSWVLKGAVMDLDFANFRFWGGYVTLGAGVTASERMKSLLTSHTNSPSSVNYSLNVLTGFLEPQRNTASNRIVIGTGAYCEFDTSNTCLWCRDLTQSGTWINTSCTVAKDQIGMDNVSNVASSLLATAPLATMLQTVAASTSGFRAFSVYIKRITGTGAIGITLDGSSFTDISSSLNTSTYTRVYITATSANPIVGFRISTSGDKIAVDFCQQEKLTGTGAPLFPTSPQLTTTTATTRLNGGGTEEYFFYTDAANTNDGIRWVNDVACKRPTSFVIVATGNGSATACNICGTDVGGYVGGAIGGGIDGTPFVGATGGIAGLGNINKMAFSIDGVGRKSCVNGNTINSTGAPFSNVQATHGGIGNNGGGALPINGYYSRATFWNRGLTDGEMLEYTR